ncbi:helix-turn-helix domain-containing protein [Alicyclobacillus suci]|uniref:helix-turn-helix domain-containing protein n=1 Tax=Alicyclobacillus suci TaxID=2816080 RepID=UPI001A901302|nr:helix-turn-helix domain-containing protein [Alicyclobacillus suci]
MAAENWHTLCVIASFMDAEGNGFPSQEFIAVRLGVVRATANKRVKRLLDYRWQGKPVVTVHKVRDDQVQNAV